MGRVSQVSTWRHFHVKEKNAKKEATCRYCSKHWANALVTLLNAHLNDCDKYQEAKTQNEDNEESDGNSETTSATDTPGSACFAGASTSTSTQPTERPSSSLSNDSLSLDQGGGPTIKYCKVKKFIDTMSKGS